MNVGDRVRYVGDITERPCDATVESVGERVGLRLDNGALFFADRADIESEEA